MGSNEHLTNAFDDEINLFDLLLILWRGKWIVLFVVLIIGIPAFLYIKRLPFEFRVESIVSSASIYEFQKLQPSILEGGEHYQIVDLVPGDEYFTILNQLSSIGVQKQFWKEYTGYDIPMSFEDRSVESVREFQSFFMRFNVVRLDKNNVNSIASVSVELEDPSKGVELLNSYLVFINKQAVDRMTSNIRSGLEAIRERLQFDYEQLKTREELSIEDQIVRLSEAFELAASLGIKETPYDQLANVELAVLDDRQYLLGTRVLAGEIKSIEARREAPIATFVDKLREMESWKVQIDNDLSKLAEAQDRANALELITPPSSSIDPIGPNKALEFLLILIFASFIGVLLVFSLSGLRNHLERQK